MIICKKKFFGSKIYKEIIYKDNRGFLVNIDHKSKLLNLKFNREIITFSKKSTLRGMHYKLKSKEAKLMTVIKGRVFEVVIDLDKKFKNF
jgi:dTDP-4-dehydrorhamnose 3,5-epimerase-like enzyme